MGQLGERGERLLLLLSSAEVAAVDAFQRKNQLPSRSAAIHEILKRSLGVPEQKAPAPSLPPRPAAGLPMTKPMTKPWHRAKKRSLNEQ